MMDRLKIAEHFYSLQGEGRSAGTPAVFLRLSGCDFSCSWCDTAEVWKRGETKTFYELDALFEMQGYYNFLRRGARLIITGGNPMLWQPQIIAWLACLKELGRNAERWPLEIETQGNILPTTDMAKRVTQWNVSPKLANSGVDAAKRLIPSVLQWHANTNSWFKFPVANPATEIAEIEALVLANHLKRGRVYLMPVCATREELNARLPAIAAAAKISGFMLSSRLQLALWDKATGV